MEKSRDLEATRFGRFDTGGWCFGALTDGDYKAIVRVRRKRERTRERPGEKEGAGIRVHPPPHRAHNAAPGIKPTHAPAIARRPRPASTQRAVCSPSRSRRPADPLQRRVASAAASTEFGETHGGSGVGFMGVRGAFLFLLPSFLLPSFLSPRMIYKLGFAGDPRGRICLGGLDAQEARVLGWPQIISGGMGSASICSVSFSGRYLYSYSAAEG
ncbi:hypothetical protein B0H16DRAFT_118544 [Mycena metata]|uniref:Uncharacterized protein n=1 Tax=Mycena metata TaxID=1033252 RepID=A0AAD7MXQ6_9AGAR|nr:hypothetical protein B0H16DRAFT_118544 [Mycena metata]